MFWLLSNTVSTEQHTHCNIHRIEYSVLYLNYHFNFLLQSHLLVPVKTNTDQALCSFPPALTTLLILSELLGGARDLISWITLFNCNKQLLIYLMAGSETSLKKKIILTPLSSIPSYCSNPFTSYAKVLWCIKNLSYPFLIQIEACMFSHISKRLCWVTLLSSCSVKSL